MVADEKNVEEIEIGIIISMALKTTSNNLERILQRRRNIGLTNNYIHVSLLYVLREVET